MELGKFVIRTASHNDLSCAFSVGTSEGFHDIEIGGAVLVCADSKSHTRSPLVRNIHIFIIPYFLHFCDIKIQIRQQKQKFSLNFSSYSLFNMPYVPDLPFFIWGCQRPVPGFCFQKCKEWSYTILDTGSQAKFHSLARLTHEQHISFVDKSAPPCKPWKSVVN